MKHNELVPFTFRDTGYTIMIRKVSPMLAIELRKLDPPPDPPTQVVDYGEGKKEVEKNYSHPDYIAAQEKYTQNFEQRIRTLAIKRGTAPGVETEDWKVEVDDLRKFWKDEYKKALPEPDDWMAFITFVCVGSEGDMEDLYKAIMSRSAPTEAAIKQAAANFRN